MCGRYVIVSDPDTLRRVFGYPEQPNFPPRYNVAPTQPVPVVRMWEGARQFALVRWGLIPSWVKDPRKFSLLINARGDTVVEKPAFRNAMRRRRCLFPADGFYEWKDEGGRKRPFHIRRRGGGPLAFAGLWEAWMGPNGEEMETAAVVTTEANRLLSSIHDRMPVIVPPEAFGLWLDATVEADVASALIRPAPEDVLEAYEVSSAVNRVANDGPGLIAPLAGGTSEPASVAKPAATKRAAKADGDGGQGSLF